VNQGVAVYGNKGSTDQHAYVQQLRDGVNNFFVTFIRVLAPRKGPRLDVEKGVETGDYLNGFLLGTREALYESQRQSITLTIAAADAFHVGVLIALFERAVGLYASLINVNAYHQPGVEAGKKAATKILKLQGAILQMLTQKPGALSSKDIGQALDASPEEVFLVAEHLVANQRLKADNGGDPVNARYSAI
jgi:glucose-6-phosphate isomerase